MIHNEHILCILGIHAVQYLNGSISDGAACVEGDKGAWRVQPTLLWVLPWLVEKQSNL